MTREERVRRLVDGELGPAEEAALIADAERDPALARLLEEASTVDRALTDLRAGEPAIPPPDFVDRVVRRAVLEREAEEKGRRGALAWLMTPRVVRVSPVTVLTPFAAAAVVGLVVMGGYLPAPESVSVSVSESESESESEAESESESEAESEAEAEAESEWRAVPVRFVLPAQGASSVAVAGDFNEWSTEDAVLDDADGDGVFVGELRLRPGSYAYMFVVRDAEGERWVTDPFAGSYRDDGFGNRNAVLRLD